MTYIYFVVIYEKDSYDSHIDHLQYKFVFAPDIYINERLFFDSFIMSPVLTQMYLNVSSERKLSA